MKELSPESSVLLVDKQTIGWEEKRTKGALVGLAPGDDIDAFVDFHVKNIGMYLNDQDSARTPWLGELYAAAQKLADISGVKVMKSKKGSGCQPSAFRLVFADLDPTVPLRQRQ